MSHETPNPKRKRRRWAIVVVLLFIATFVGWWNYPRGDARFVGNWKHSLDVSGAAPRELSLWSSGAGVIDVTFIDMTKGQMRLNWRVENGQLCLGGPHAAWTAPYLIRLQRAMKWLTGTTFYSGEMKYDIVEITHDTIRLEGVGPSGREKVILTRLPE